MKKILAIAVALMYLAITSGLVLQIHYCMGRQVGSSVKFAELDSHTCAECGMANAKNKCCHDEVKFVKLQDVHQQVCADYTIPAAPAVVQNYNLLNFSLQAFDEPVESCSNAPPNDDDGQPPLFIFHHLFRI